MNLSLLFWLSLVRRRPLDLPESRDAGPRSGRGANSRDFGCLHRTLANSLLGPKNKTMQNLDLDLGWRCALPWVDWRGLCRLTQCCRALEFYISRKQLLVPALERYFPNTCSPHRWDLALDRGTICCDSGVETLLACLVRRHAIVSARDASIDSRFECELF